MWSISSQSDRGCFWTARGSHACLIHAVAVLGSAYCGSSEAGNDDVGCRLHGSLRGIGIAVDVAHLLGSVLSFSTSKSRPYRALACSFHPSPPSNPDYILSPCYAPSYGHGVRETWAEQAFRPAPAASGSLLTVGQGAARDLCRRWWMIHSREAVACRHQHCRLRCCCSSDGVCEAALS